jgi:2'-5' RNA ligase
MDAIRAFIALELPAPILEQLDQIEAQLKPQVPHDCVRWVKSDSVHLTLKFLGQVPSDQLELITSSLKLAVVSHLPFDLEVSGVGCFPNVHRPRVIWVGVKEIAAGNRLQHLQRAVENAIAPLGYPTEQREFSPHLTLGRLARDVRSADLKNIGGIIAATHVGSLGRWQVVQIALIRSDLKPTGAVYTVLARVPLAAK